MDRITQSLQVEPDDTRIYDGASHEISASAPALDLQRTN